MPGTDKSNKATLTPDKNVYNIKNYTYSFFEAPGYKDYS